MDFSEEYSEQIEKFKDFVGYDKRVFKYLHNAPTKEVANEIIVEGFEFESHLHNTTDMVSGLDPIELKYFLFQRKNYGIYTVVLQISKELIDLYSEKLKKTRYHFYEVLSKYEPRLSSEDNLLYTLHEQFVKGYFNQKTYEACINPKFDPFTDLPLFQENLNRILKQSKK